MQSTGNISLRCKRRVSAGLKKRIAYRQHYVCNICHILLPPTYEVDHVLALFLGGTNSETNLQALCPNCHREKTQTESLPVLECPNCKAVTSPYFVHTCKTTNSLRRFLKT